MSDDFHIQVRNVQRYEKALKTYAGRALPFAAREALNTTAFTMRAHWQDDIRRTMINRNKFTAGAIRVSTARGLRLHDMQSRTGAIEKADYLETQEFGGTVRGKSGAKGIPTEAAAGQSKGSRPRTRLVRAPNKVTALPKTPRGASSSRKARNARAIANAVRKGTRVAFLRMASGKKGLYRITGRGKSLKILKLWDLTRRSVQVKPNPTRKRSYAKTLRAFPAIYSKALRSQLQRHRIFAT